MATLVSASPKKSATSARGRSDASICPLKLCPRFGCNSHGVTIHRHYCIYPALVSATGICPLNPHMGWGLSNEVFIVCSAAQVASVFILRSSVHQSLSAFGPEWLRYLYRDRQRTLGIASCISPLPPLVLSPGQLPMLGSCASFSDQ